MLGEGFEAHPLEDEGGDRRLGLGLRAGPAAIDRRQRQRRAVDRGTCERRRSQRRRNTVRGLLFGLFTMAIPAGTASKAPSSLTTSSLLRAYVSVESSFRVVPPELAYEDLIQEAARRYHLDADLIRAVIRAESAFDPFAVSRAGAQGLMQLMPALAQEMGVIDPFDPHQNIHAGARYLRELLDHHRGNLELAVASYNAGPTAVARSRGIPPYKETRNYVRTVKRYLTQAQAEGD